MMTMKTTKDETGLDSVTPESLRDASHFRRIIAARKALEAAQQELRDAVAAARSAGDSWTVVGAAMGTTKQAAYQRFAHDVEKDAQDNR
jgi:3-keto-L-gulonate-6-phosphate decarboxylase